MRSTVRLPSSTRRSDTLQHELTLHGPAFRLRPVTLNDAETILELRRDPSRSRFIHETDPSIEAQREWLESYFERDNDFYWAVERLDDGSTEGFIGIYGIDGTWAEWGRWVLRPGSLAGPESAWLVYEAGFTLLHLESMISRTLTENRAVVAFHERSGAELVGILPRLARIGGVDYDAVERRMTPPLWATSGPRLYGMAERAARLLHRPPAGGGPVADPGRSEA